MAEVKPGAKEEKASNTTNATADKEAAQPTKVTYTGSSTFRRITRDDWKAAGVEDQEAIYLGRGESVPLDTLNERAVEVLRRDGNFKFE